MKNTLQDRKLYVRVFTENHLFFEKTFSKFPVTIGRSFDADIPLSQLKHLSRLHLSIVRKNGAFVVLAQKDQGFQHQGVACTELQITESTTLQLGQVHIYLSCDEDQHFNHFPLDGVFPIMDEDELCDIPNEADIYSRTLLGDGPQVKNVAPMAVEQGPATIEHRHQRVLQVQVIWKGQLYSSDIFRPGEAITMGRENCEIYLPVLAQNYHLADFDGRRTSCYLPRKCDGQFLSQEGATSLKSLINSDKLPVHNGRKKLSLKKDEACHIFITENIQVQLSYVQAPRQLAKGLFKTPDDLFQKTLVGSGVSHLLVVLFMLLFAPREPQVKMRKLPPRLAKLLVKKNKPKPPAKKKKKLPEPEKKVVQKKTVKKKLKKKVVKRKPRKPKRVVVRKTVKMKKLNKYPYKVKSRVRANTKVLGAKSKKSNIKKLGALAALGAMGKPKFNPKNKAVALNINPNAGGASSKRNPKGIIGTLKTKNGRLAASGMGTVKTRGRGFGSGSGYGVQGLKGRAGQRGVAGAVLGRPSLMKIKRSEGLTRKQVMAVVRKHTGEIQACYERALLSRPDLSGRVEYEWHIQPRGRVKWTKVKRAEMSGGGALNNCVTKVFKAMRFPVAKNGESTVPSIGFPFGRQ